ncbi:MAG: V4R domain-containing protein [Candidatus Bathyarchaeia archaeon]
MDITDSNISIEEFIEKIRKIKGVIGVQILYPLLKVWADNLSVRLIVADERAIIFHRPRYKWLFSEIRKQFGTAGGASLYYIGYGAGMRYGRDHQKIADKLGTKDPIQIAHKITAPLSQSMGRGRTEIVEAKADIPKIILKLYECFECELGAGNKKPYSQFIRGTLAGFSAQLFNRKMEAKESQCIAKGDSYCKFTITSSK